MTLAEKDNGACMNASAVEEEERRAVEEEEEEGLCSMISILTYLDLLSSKH